MNRQEAGQKWIERRLERLRFEWAESRGLAAETAVARGYVEPKIGLSSLLSREVLQLTEQAWILWGPHVPAPPVRYSALVMPILQMASRLHPLLAAWVLTEVGNHVRRHGWARENRYLFQLAGQMKSGVFKRYTEWIIGRIDLICEEIATPIEHEERQKMALRVVREMYLGVGLSGFVRRFRLWEEAHQRGMHYCQHVNSCIETDSCETRQFLSDDEIREITPDGFVIKHLWRKKLLEAEGAEMRHCVGAMGSAISGMVYMFFSLIEAETSRRATMVLALSSNNSWYVEQLSGLLNEPVGPEIESAAKKVLVALNGLRSSSSLLQMYIIRNMLIRSDSRCKRCEENDYQKLRGWIPGIGKKDPRLELADRWSRMALK